MAFSCRLKSVLAAVLVLAGTSVALAAPAEVTSQLEVHKVVVKDGKTELETAKKAYPGDLLDYQLDYLNHTGSSIHQLTATLPVPQGAVFVPGGPGPSPEMASVDGVHFQPYPLETKVVSHDGKATQVPVPFSQYRAVRWSGRTLQPHDTLALHMRVRVQASR